MQTLFKAIGGAGLSVPVDDEKHPVGSGETVSETEVSRRAQQVRDLLVGTLPLEVPASAEPVPCGAAEDVFALTDIQYAYLIGRNPGLGLGGVPSSIYFELDTAGLDLPALNAALDETVKRHPMLRAVVVDGGRQQVLQALPPYEIALEDVGGRAPEDRQARLAEIREEMEATVLPVDRAPPFAVRATVIDAETTRLHVCFDLMFLDVRSVDLVMRDWWRLYRRLDSQDGHDIPAFAAYLDAERSLQEQRQGERDRQYWSDLLESLPPPPDLPLKRSPELITPPAFRRASRHVPSDVLDRLRQAATKRGLTLETVFLGAYAETLRQWSKRQTFTLTLTQLSRRPHFPGVDRIVGNFLQPVLLAVGGSPAKTLTERLVDLQTDLILNRYHSTYSGVQVLRDLTRHNQENRAASAPVVFNNTLTSDLQQAVPEADWDGATCGYASSKTPQVWIENQLSRIGGEVWMNWNYVDGLFPDGTVDAMQAACTRLLVSLADDASAWDLTGAVVALPPEDLAERNEANDTAVAVETRLLHAMVLDAAAATPDAVAVVQGDRSLTFGELIAGANRVARRLRDETGVRPGDLVAVSFQQTPELLVGILGVLVSGAAYVSIDPALPLQRRQSLVARCAAKAMVTESRVVPTGDDYADVVRIALDDERTRATAADPLSQVQSVDDLAYVIFTSGSTGEPKGVMISHRNAYNTVLDINRRFGVGARDAVFSVAPAGFDLSVYDYFGVLGAGGRVVFQDLEAANDPKAWAETIVDRGVTVWNSVPAPMKALVDRCGADLAGSRLRLILMSGDWIPTDLPGRIRQTLPDASVVSLGGATEGSIWSIHYPIAEVDPAWTSIPYGKPLTNQRFHVLNDWLAPSPKWVTGELYIAGWGVAQGYLGDPEKTAQRFVTHPATGERLYKTGDLGRYLADGIIEILGREDNQVKINGYRVELGEVEACLLVHPCALHVVIDAPTHPRTGQRHLVAYVVAADDCAGREPAELQEALKETARASLPSYMVPTYCVLVPEMPLTPNGKIDRKALPSPWTDAEDDAEASTEPASETEARVLSIWQKQLRHEDFGLTDGFFDVGGDSLHAVGLLSAIREHYAVPPTAEQELIEALFMNADVRTFAGIIDGMPAEDGE